MNRYLAAGLSALAGAALFEAVVPAAVIGGAVLFAPRYIPKLRRQLQSALDAVMPSRDEAPAQSPDQPDPKLPVPAPARFAIKQAVAKTITFRVIVTSLDFTTNYMVLGEFATAAGLSTFALVTGPLFYLAHETTWNYLGPSGETVDLSTLAPRKFEGERPTPYHTGFAISRALAKTITFRTIATVTDFTTTYVVIGDVAIAAGLSAFGFVLGPFVYFGHERTWDYFTADKPVRGPA